MSVNDNNPMAGWDQGAAPVSPSGERPWTSPGPAPWAAPAKRKTSPLLIIAVVVGAMLLLCSGLGAVALLAGEEPKKTSVTTDSSEAADAGEGAGHIPAAPAVGTDVASYKVGKTFTSGDFRYTIHAVKTGIVKVGGQYSAEKAQGAFTRLDITVKNVGDEAHYFDTDQRIKVEDRTGRQFSSDTGANIFGNEGEDGWLTEINPGNAIRAYAFFDLPEGVKASRAVIGAGLFSFEPDAVVPLP